MNLLESIPRKDGFRMPAEFEPHSKCWMIWPERPDNWRNGAKPAQEAYSKVAEAISQFEKVTVCVSHEQYYNARKKLPPRVRVVEMSSNDAWMRDVGPTFVVNDEGIVRAVRWKFNAWGGLYFPWDKDELVALKVADMEEMDCYQAPMVLEGGSIDVDGEGTLITTEECLLNSNRNPQLSKEQIEQFLKDYLGVEKIIWLKRGVYNDETSGHVDNLCRFVRPGEAVLTWTEDRNDPQYEISRENYEILSKETDARRRRLKIHLIHQPSPIYVTEEEDSGVDFSERTHRRPAGYRLPASYVNFYFARGALIVPVFNDPKDKEALRKFREILPDRKIVPVYAREILLGGGAIHCITLQQPLGVRRC
ncbi:agmatine deiminase [Thermotoga sp. Ku-13t]|uniref:agmatine deiminase n=1 Tax=Thermotoga sp. Ku-13t TaxID=1755813 RepID=UPI0013EDC183|nr:agmatine deiminase [Thermotoga sp. Ku-13t]KAF2957976.1 agmatine deiminase [Thermotoga sp. Ku-13t]